MTSYSKWIGDGKGKSPSAFLHQAQLRLLGGGARHYSRAGFKNIRLWPVMRLIPSYSITQIVGEHKFRFLRRSVLPTRYLGHFTGAQARGPNRINKLLDSTAEIETARRIPTNDRSTVLEGWFWVGFSNRHAFKRSNFKEPEARQGSRRAKKTPRMAKMMN